MSTRIFSVLLSVLLSVFLAIAAVAAGVLVSPTGPAHAASGDSIGFPSNKFKRLDIEMAQYDHQSVGVIIGGIFDGVAARDPISGPETTWEESTDSYVGPNYDTYRRYRNKANGQCLTHSGGYVGTEPCDWNGTDQWWAGHYTFVDLCGGDDLGPACILDYTLIRPWNAPTLAMTLAGDFIIVAPVTNYVTNVEQQRFSWMKA